MRQGIAEVQERNREIGKLLQEARVQKNIPLTTCAELIYTSRRRYAAMERGETAIGVAELELLMDFLEIPAHQIWRDERSEKSPRQVFVTAQPGEVVEIVVDVQK